MTHIEIQNFIEIYERRLLEAFAACNLRSAHDLALECFKELKASLNREKQLKKQLVKIKSV